jgi:hypothetical protein
VKKRESDIIVCITEYFGEEAPRKSAEGNKRGEMRNDVGFHYLYPSIRSWAGLIT